MAEAVKPGQWITVKIKSLPRAAARRKTMVRLFRQDPAVKRERTRQKRTRPHEPSNRGGRIWMNKPPQLDVVQTQPGATYRIYASVSVLRDLASIEPYVQVAPAK